MDAIVFQKKITPRLVSVVIPTCRSDRFIGDTLATVGGQVYTNWEVIVVEDGSIGLTQRIVSEFARHHRKHRVVYCRNERNCGAAHSRNVAFAQAAGEYVALLDADDRWAPDHLAVSEHVLRTTDKDIVYSSVVMVADGADHVLGIWGPTAHEVQDFPHTLFGRNFVTPSATVMRRQVLADVGPWSTTHMYCEDFDFWLRCVAAGKAFHYIGGAHCLYRKDHAGATTQRLCGTLEEAAMTTEHYMHMAGMRPKTCRKFAAKAYLAAAKCHRTADPLTDPSVNRSRAGKLMLKGWQLRKKRVRYLFEGLWLNAVARIRYRNQDMGLPSPNPYPAIAPQRPAVDHTHLQAAA